MMRIEWFTGMIVTVVAAACSAAPDATPPSDDAERPSPLEAIGNEAIVLPDDLAPAAAEEYCGECAGDACEYGMAVEGATGGASANQPDCSDNAKKGRIEKEKTLQQDLINNNCLPNNVTSDPCKSIYGVWKKIKDENGVCNAIATGCSLCNYYKSAIANYEQRLAQYCNPPKALPPGIEGLTIRQYCDYARLSLEYFEQRKQEECIVITMQAPPSPTTSVLHAPS